MITKLITLIHFPVIYLKDKTKQQDYMTLVLNNSNFLSNIQNKNVTKKTLLKDFYSLYKNLIQFYVNNAKILTSKEKRYFNSLKNLILQLKRYFKIQAASTFLTMLPNLTEKEVLLGIEELSNTQITNKKTNVTKKLKISKSIPLLEKPYLFDYKVTQLSKKKGKNTFKGKK